LQISKGVEWAVHAASLMAALPEGRGLKAAALARYHELPTAYMAKQLQALSKAGLVRSSRGAHGGYRLARPAEAISLWDITAAVDGAKSAFRCLEIRQNGPCALARKDCRAPCQIAAAFAAAERAFRNSLKAVSLADLGAQFAASTPPEHLQGVIDWLSSEAEPLSQTTD
jgi:Rrf2 family protein